MKVSELCHKSVALNEARGGVVLTDPSQEASVSLAQGGVIPPGPWCPPEHPDCREWLAVGAPACWGPTQCYGDADGLTEGSAKAGLYRVGLSDLNILILAWMVTEPPHGPGIVTVHNGICADFNRRAGGSDKTGFHRVGPADLNILIGNWLVNEPPKGPGVPTNCNELP